MTGLTHKTRAVIVMVGLSLGFSVLGCRLFDLHVMQHRDLAQRALANRERVIKREGRRGEIRDVNGYLLANSQSVRIIGADPSITASNAAAIARELAPLLRMPESDLMERLSRSGHYVCLKNKVDEDTFQKISALKIRGLSSEPQFLRSYPNGVLASHVLGFVNGDHKGAQGIEVSMEQYLEGIPGYEVVERNGHGSEIRALRDEEIGPHDGYHVVLTIDQVIQHIAETELDKAMALNHPLAGVIIVSRPKTGEILAMSCRPTFDPNDPGAAPAEARRNRCISDEAEPGSTFKIVVCSGALSEGLVTLEDRFDCENGAFLYAGRILHDAHPYGILPVEAILYKSSNIGAAKVALRMGPARLYEYITRFGLGRKTGIALPAEVSGIAHPLSRWNKLSITRVPMGHEIAVTPIQMLMAMNAVANGGRLMKPLIVKNIVGENGHVVMACQPQQVAQSIFPRASILMTTALRKVVTPEGTAPKAAVDGYDVAGKTGTASKLENGQYVHKYYSSFVGYFPASDPEISILVSLDDPQGDAYYGGSVSGPVFSAVAEKTALYLNIPPQIPDSKQVASLR